MSIYDRDYMRGYSSTSRLKYHFVDTPAVCWLITLNILMFVLSVVVPPVYNFLALSPQSVSSFKIWTLFSYGFLHGGMLHILFNLLGLFFMGRPLEKWLGTKKFLLVYLSGVVLGGLFWLCFSWGEGSVLVGASAGVMAVLSAFCMMYPPTPITFLIFFIIPVRVRPLTMLKIVAVVEFLGFISSISGGDSSIAYSAHLGGLVAGLGIIEFIKRGRFSFLDKVSADKFLRFTRKKKTSGGVLKFKVDVSADDAREVDRILEKVNREGFASLSDEEREFLRRANK